MSKLLYLVFLVYIVKLNHGASIAKVDNSINENLFNDVKIVVSAYKTNINEYSVNSIFDNSYILSTDEWYIIVYFNTDFEIPLNVTYMNRFPNIATATFKSENNKFQTKKSIANVVIICKDSNIDNSNSNSNSNPLMFRTLKLLKDSGTRFNRYDNKVRYFGNCFTTVSVTFNYKNTNTGQSDYNYFSTM
ncbi:protein C13 [BeAn 58058 virus]|uniref:protein C13 n=1 Tax=BeAn 58058 virus TaxID=67082 RepID=UPI000909EEA9|nr:protein C13 [BeAn 58058 virus]APG58388.1 protein C13 [BeAn 58058 virus]